jgi:hypothetical protein
MLRLTFLGTCAVCALTSASAAPRDLEAGTVPNAAISLQDCRFEADRSATVAVGTARRLVLDAGAGSLRVEGRTGLTEVRIRGRACASHEALLEQLDFDAAHAGDVIEVRTHEVENRDWRGRHYARLDLTLEVPAGLDADISDGSGDLVGLGLGETNIEDGSGEIDLSDIRGRLTIDDGSGEIRIRNVDGDVTIDDGSGQIDLLRITGTVRIDDRSGDIDVDDVGGDFIVASDGSGSLDYRRVRGAVDIPRRGRRR